jgi:hypothetical protein
MGIKGKLRNILPKEKSEEGSCWDKYLAWGHSCLNGFLFFALTNILNEEQQESNGTFSLIAVVHCVTLLAGEPSAA